MAIGLTKDLPERATVVQTSEAERIGVDQVAKILPSGKASGSDQCKREPLPSLSR